VQAGAEPWSDRRAAKLLGTSRVSVWRMHLLAVIPESLLNKLEKLEPKVTKKELEFIARWLTDTQWKPENEYCPHCGGLVRHRKIKDSVFDAVEAWQKEQKDDAS
jgi:hypothetical protein